MPTTIDNNFYGIGKAVKNNANQDIASLLVDPVTGRLLVVIYYETSNDLILTPRIDNNWDGVAMAITNNGSADILPIKVKASNGALLVDIA